MVRTKQAVEYTKIQDEASALLTGIIASGMVLRLCRQYRSATVPYCTQDSISLHHIAGLADFPMLTAHLNIEAKQLPASGTAAASPTELAKQVEQSLATALASKPLVEDEPAELEFDGLLAVKGTLFLIHGTVRLKLTVRTV